MPPSIPAHLNLSALPFTSALCFSIPAGFCQKPLTHRVRVGHRDLIQGIHHHPAWRMQNQDPGFKPLQLPPLTEHTPQAGPALLIHSKCDINQVIPRGSLGPSYGIFHLPQYRHTQGSVTTSQLSCANPDTLNCLQPSVHASERTHL